MFVICRYALQEDPYTHEQPLKCSPLPPMVAKTVRLVSVFSSSLPLSRPTHKAVARYFCCFVVTHSRRTLYITNVPYHVRGCQICYPNLSSSRLFLLDVCSAGSPSPLPRTKRKIRCSVGRPRGTATATSGGGQAPRNSEGLPTSPTTTQSFRCVLSRKEYSRGPYVAVYSAK